MKAEGVVVLACTLVMTGASADNKFPYAAARGGCTQEDARALELLFTQVPISRSGLPTQPFIRVEISWGDWHIGEDLTLGHPARPSNDHRIIARAELSRDSRTPVWLEGIVRLTKIEVDHHVAGLFQFIEPGAANWRGTFDAGWIEGRHGCG